MSPLVLNGRRVGNGLRGTSGTPPRFSHGMGGGVLQSADRAAPSAHRATGGMAALALKQVVEDEVDALGAPIAAAEGIDFSTAGLRPETRLFCGGPRSERHLVSTTRSRPGVGSRPISMWTSTGWPPRNGTPLRS